MPLFRKKASAPDLAQGIDAFWAWWAAAGAAQTSAAIADRAPDRMVDELSRRVNGIHPGLAWELASGRRAQHVLVVSPEGNPDLRSAARRWLRAAPEPDATWEYADARQPVPDLDDIRLSLGKQTVCFGDTLVTARRVGHHFDVTVHHPVFEEIPVEAQLQITYLALDAALGEVDVETWIGEIEPAALAPLDAFPLHHLSRLVADLREELTDADGSPTWVILKGSGPEGPVMALAQVPLAPTTAPELDEHVAVAATYDQLTDEGFPGDPSLEALRTLEDRLADVLDGRGRLVAHESSGGRRTLHFYVDSATGATGELLAAARDWRLDGVAGVVHTAAEPDPGWSAVRHLRA
ncbi:MAG: DUF695 domain-containing protein [Nocardioidaceae bacterium]